MMKIIAIDPGYDRIGFAILEEGEDKNKPEIIFSECFQTEKSEKFEDRMKSVGDRVRELIKKYNPDVLGVESLFFAKNTKTVMKVSEVKGVLTFIALEEKLEFVEFMPNEIKVALTGYGKATKKDIEFILQKVYNIDTKNKIDDEMDAIALGITYFATNKYI